MLLALNGLGRDGPQLIERMTARAVLEGQVRLLSKLACRAGLDCNLSPIK